VESTGGISISARVVNMVVLVRLSHRINPYEVCMSFRYCTKSPRDKAPRVYFPPTRAFVSLRPRFCSVVGARSAEELDEILSSLRSRGVPVDRWNLVNVVWSGLISMGGEPVEIVDLWRAALTLSNFGYNVVYDPAQFPGVRVVLKRANLSLFRNGRFTLLGKLNEEEVRDVVGGVVEHLLAHGLIARGGNSRASARVGLGRS